MKNKIVQLQEIEKYKNFLGSKTLNLKRCADFGFDVPKFIALSSCITSDLLTNEIFRREIIQEVETAMQCERYAVRSSALIEDGESQSFAGQFLTKINLVGDELDQAIEDVLAQAKSFLGGNLDGFSIIIQEYVVADIAGITFTRNPNGDREMMIEYGFCDGEKLVGGQIKPEKLSFYWNEQAKGIFPKQFLTFNIVEKFKELETQMSFPQDIEWCIGDGKFYLLQTRPITTISEGQYEQILYAEDFLPEDGKYYFEKTEVSEISPRPSVVTKNLLNLIYMSDGPVARVYEKYGIRYENTNFLKIIGNELFVDREKEIQGLLPAYSYLQNNKFIPRLCKFSKLLPTIRNFFFLNKVGTNNYENIFGRLKEKIEAIKDNSLDTKSMLEKFLFDYDLIFETNLLSGLSIKKANLLLKNEPVQFHEILGSASLFIDLKKYAVDAPANLLGNLLEISDESIFIATEKTENKIGKNVLTWWDNVPEYKKRIMNGKIIEAIIYNRLREFGRWLTIKNINALKSSLLICAEKEKFVDSSNIFFANLEDVLKNNLNEDLCIKNRDKYQTYSKFNFPNRLTSIFINNEANTLGVSVGSAGGALWSRELIDANENQKEKVILYTEVLSPDLTRYFDRISGIISNNGGMLSHLAIMARENSIPMIVGFSINNSDEINLGDYVEIDGTNGKIAKK